MSAKVRLVSRMLFAMDYSVAVVLRISLLRTRVVIVKAGGVLREEGRQQGIIGPSVCLITHLVSLTALKSQVRETSGHVVAWLHKKRCDWRDFT